MYQIYKKGMWGNRVPYMVAAKPTADRIVREMRDELALVVEVPRNVQALIRM